MRDIVLAIIVFGSVPFVLKRPYIGILLLAWLGYMNPHRLCWGFMFSMPAVQTVALATMLGMLISKEPKRMIWSREIIVLGIFVAWMGVTTIAAFYFNPALEMYQRIVKIQILTVMTLLMLTSENKVRAFIWVMVLSLGFFGIKGGIFTILKGGTNRVWGPAGTFIGGNNELALALVMTIPLLRYLQLTEKNFHIRIALGVSMLLLAISTLGSQSRGALLGLVITGSIFWFKSRNKFATGILIVVAAVLVISIMPESWYQRMDTINTYQQDKSALGRINAWWMAWNLARHDVFGGGFETWTLPVFMMYAPDTGDVHDAHSIYFKVLGEHGFIGLFLFLTLLAMTWRKCSAVIHMCKNRPERKWAADLCAMIQVSMVGYMSAGAFLGLAYFDFIYHLIAVVVVVHHMMKSPALAPTSTLKQAPAAAPSTPLAGGRPEARPG